MRFIFLAAAVYGGILGPVSRSFRPIHQITAVGSYMQAQREARREISRAVYDRVIGDVYSTLSNNKVNGTRLTAEAVFDPAVPKMDLNFWRGAHEKVQPDFSFPLEYRPTPGRRVFQYPGDLRHLRSIRIQTWEILERRLSFSDFPRHMLRSRATKAFNEKFGDFLKAGKDDFKNMYFIPDGDRDGTDQIILTIGGNLFRLYPKSALRVKH